MGAADHRNSVFKMIKPLDPHSETVRKEVALWAIEGRIASRLGAGIPGLRCEKPRNVIRDRDGTDTSGFIRRLTAIGIATARSSPWQTGSRRG